MENIKQRIGKLYENGVNYKFNREENERYEYNEENIIKNYDDFIPILENKISIITGCNGIGKTHLLNLINEKFMNKNSKTKLLKLKEYNSLDEIKNKNLDEYEIVVFDGLDEINANIVKEILEKEIFNDIRRINLFEIFRDKEGNLHKFNIQRRIQFT